MHVKVVYDLLFNIWAKDATISGTLSSVKIVNNEIAILGWGILSEDAIIVWVIETG